MTSMAVCKEELSKEHSVFDVAKASLLNFSHSQAVANNKTVQDMLQIKNTAVLRKFCDVCKFLNIDPVHRLSLPLIVIFMCKSKHCVDIAQAFIKAHKCEELILNMEVYDMETQKICDHLLNTIADWIVLFSYFEIIEYDSQNEAIAQNVKDIENNNLLRSMRTCLVDANVMPFGEKPNQRISMSHTAVLAFLYMSPRKTPSGKMLEMLYTEIASNARDVELRCLRAMTAFKDRQDDENAYAETLPIVLSSLRVNDKFQKGIRAVLRKQTIQEETDVDSETLRLAHKNKSRPLLREFVDMSLKCRKVSQNKFTWHTFRDQLCFPPTTSPNMQRLLYFIIVQRVQADRSLFEGFYTKEICNKATTINLENTDSDAVMQVVNSLRVYNTKIKHLIDFRSKCLQGLNQKTRNSLSIVQVLQLYIASYQQDHIRWDCWKKIEKTMNHTINDTVTNFVNTYPYDIDGVVQNLIHSQIHDS